MLPRCFARLQVARATPTPENFQITPQDNAKLHSPSRALDFTSDQYEIHVGKAEWFLPLAIIPYTV